MTPVRILTAALSSAGLVLASAIPASAAEVVNWEAEPTYTPLEALGLFVGVPATVFLVVLLAVYAPGWSKKGKGESGGPVWETSPAGAMAAPSGPGIITPSGPTDHTDRGGASGQW